MADKSSSLVLTALGRAAASTSLPLYGSRTAAGLFPTTAAGKQAAQRCQDEGYLCLLTAADAPEPASGPRAATAKKTAPLCAITDKGLTYLLSQVSPRQVLEDFVRALEARRRQADDLLDLARRMQQGLDTLKANAEKVLRQACPPEPGTENGSLKALFRNFLNEPSPVRPEPAASSVDGTLLAELDRWQSAGAAEDCSLPHLYRQASAAAPGLTIGQYHDALRRLHDHGKIYLHPWTGPLYDIPEPPYALLVGHEIAYYASRK